MNPTILVVEDEVRLGKNLRTFFERQGFQARHVTTGREAIDAYEAMQPDFVVLDYKLPDIDGLQVLTRLRKKDHAVKAVMITGEGNLEIAMSALKAGAHGYLTKPIMLEELKLVLDQVTIQQQRLDLITYHNRRLAAGATLADLVGDSPPLMALKEQVRESLLDELARGERAADPILIAGEPGSGKRLIARIFHYEGSRATAPFVELDCLGAEPHHLEGELFGEETAAGRAVGGNAGLVEVAHGGTLFLRNIEGLDRRCQEKIWLYLESHEFNRRNGIRTRASDARVIAASAAPLEALSGKGLFHANLLKQLTAQQIVVPPLRKRGRDVDRLAAMFLNDYGRRYGKPGLELQGTARAKLRQYGWPGNVRELAQVMERAVLTARRHQIESQDLLIG